MPEAQAEAVAEATRDAITADAATKADIAELKHDIERLEASAKADFAAVRSEIAAVRSDLTHEIAAMGMSVTVRLGTLIAVGVGILAALIKL